MNKIESMKKLRKGYYVLTGGAGFLGCNLADALASRGEQVVIVDNLSRRGTGDNLKWLRTRHPRCVKIEVADIQDVAVLNRVVQGACGVVHLAAQVAVTTSILDPVADFDTNARGTLNVLEAVRTHNPDIPLIFASTNKVYGQCQPVGGLLKEDLRYRPAATSNSGFDETTPLDFHSPYGCSKGVADQYVYDYGRVFGLRTAVFRMSCLYGPHQFGVEDQGWVAHFAKQTLNEQIITIYGDGCQVRDALYVDDAVEAYLRALDNFDSVAGRAFNLGGGLGCSLSLRELLRYLREITGLTPRVTYSDWRPGDQAWYVSQTNRLEAATGWRPTTSLNDGLRSLIGWLRTGSVADQKVQALR